MLAKKIHLSYSYILGLVLCPGISSMCLVSGACMHLYWVKIMVCLLFFNFFFNFTNKRLIKLTLTRDDPFTLRSHK